MVFVVEKKEKKTKKNNNWNFRFGFFGPKMAVSWRISAFQKKNLAETPILIVLFGARFLGQVVKKGKFWTPTKIKRKIWLIIEKLFFGILCAF